MHLSMEREVWGLNLAPVESDTVLPTASTAVTFLRKKQCYPDAMTRKRAPLTRYTLRHNTASIKKDLILFELNFRDFSGLILASNHFSGLGRVRTVLVGPFTTLWQTSSMAVYLILKMSFKLIDEMLVLKQSITLVW